jgi:hypothetical protein
MKNRSDKKKKTPKFKGTQFIADPSSAYLKIGV